MSALGGRVVGDVGRCVCRDGDDGWWHELQRCVVVWDDGDDTLAEPRSPYPHAREVAMLRAHQLRCAALIGGYARTAEAQALVGSGWAHDLVAARPVVRSCAPRVVAIDDDGFDQRSFALL